MPKMYWCFEIVWRFSDSTLKTHRYLWNRHSLGYTKFIFLFYTDAADVNSEFTQNGLTNNRTIGFETINPLIWIYMKTWSTQDIKRETFKRFLMNEKGRVWKHEQYIKLYLVLNNYQKLRKMIKIWQHIIKTKKGICKISVGTKWPNQDTKRPVLGYETIRLWVRNKQTAGYKATRLLRNVQGMDWPLSGTKN